MDCKGKEFGKYVPEAVDWRSSMEYRLQEKIGIYKCSTFSLLLFLVLAQSIRMASPPPLPRPDPHHSQTLGPVSPCPHSF